ncbi:MAG: PorT family protein [Bryobacterales bacterium]|nr:PorT family protein [Bryobacterales bacterium]
MRLSMLLCALAGLAAGQSQDGISPRFSPGVTLGVETGRMSGGFRSGGEESKRWTVGPAVDISLAGNWSVTINPHYKRLGNSQHPIYLLPEAIPDGSTVFTHQRLRMHSLEAPVVGKYHFGAASRRVRLFAGTGYAFRVGWANARWTSSVRDGGAVRSQTANVNYRTSLDNGVVAALGAAIRRGPVIFTPELRYTRWGSVNDGWDRNQVEVLLTIRWGGRK